jgi:hypothetical protein
MDVSAVKEAIERISPLGLFIGAGAAGLIVMVFATCSMYDSEGPLPPPRDPPPPPEDSAVSSYRYKEGYYHALVDEDAKKVGAGVVDIDKLKKGYPYRVEFTGNQHLVPGQKLETQHLLLEAIRLKVWVGGEGQGYRTGHLGLRITNRSDRHIAYRVVSRAVGRCGRKGAVDQNALALAPGDKTARTECLLRKSRGLRVKRVEVMEITPLGYHYLSRLDPIQIGLETRTAAGHQPAGLPQCRIVPWRMIKRLIKAGDLRWRDVIDFYARHNCDEYSFFAQYRWREQGPKRVPAIPPEDAGG